MLGSLLAGMDESPVKLSYMKDANINLVEVWDLGAMKQGSGDRYFQESSEASKLVPEGIEGMDTRGQSNTIHQIIGGVRSSMGYCGCRDIKEFRTKTLFTQITSAV